MPAGIDATVEKEKKSIMTPEEVARKISREAFGCTSHDQTILDRAAAIIAADRKEAVAEFVRELLGSLDEASQPLEGKEAQKIIGMFSAEMRRLRAIEKRWNDPKAVYRRSVMLAVEAASEESSMWKSIKDELLAREKGTDL